MPPRKVKQINADPFWDWTHDIIGDDSISAEHVRAAYRLFSVPCVPGACKKNCRTNPCCLSGLGELQWFKNEPTESTLSSENIARRKKGEVIGLRNLGATCYVNAFLQMCFHNRDFRSAIYAWRSTFQCNTGSGDDAGLPTTVCGLLQYVFASLELSEMKVVDPTPLLRKLKLDDLEQQDALEFGKLFLNLLTSLPDEGVQTASSESPNKVLRVRITEMFSGVCQYITRCHSCNMESAATASYTEIDARVEGMHGLTEALADYLKDETMDGENMYSCDVCGSKQTASRRIKLKSAPPVLQVHLLRYVYDRKRCNKKKVRTPFQFPEVLAMGPYLGKGENDDLYDLSAILLHNGIGAYSGHYIAHIRMPDFTETAASADALPSTSTQSGRSSLLSKSQQLGTTCWFKFSDEVIEPISNLKTQLGKIENEKDEAKTPKVPCGCLSSSNAYMLLYKRRLDTTGSVRLATVDVPENIRNILYQENDVFLSTIAKLEKDSMQRKESESTIRDFVKETYRLLWLPRDFLTSLTSRAVFAISNQWLSQWLKHPEEAAKIDNKLLMCEHGKINVDELTNIKYVSETGARKLFERYGVSSELDLTMTCIECVTRVCSRKRLEVQIVKDICMITSEILPDRRLTLEGFIVGKGSLRALKALMERHVAQAFPHRASAAQDSTELQRSAKLVESVDAAGRSAVTFNGDILCQHGHLCIDERQWIVVTVAAWQKLKQYFPSAPEFSAANPEACRECKNVAAVVKETASKSRAIALELRERLDDVIAFRRRPQPYVDTEVYIIGRSFIDSLRQFISSRRTDLSFPHLDHAQLMCIHGKLYAEPTDSTIMIPLWPEEWCILLQYCGESSSPVSVFKKQEVIGDMDERQSYVVLPGVCQACLEERLAKIKNLRFKYVSAKLVVSRVSGFDARATCGGISVQDDDDDSDIDFMNQQSSSVKSAKKIKIAHADPSASGATAAITDAEAVGTRRSNRRVRSRNDKEVTVSSSMTLKELKVLLMNEFAVAPFDQTLMLDGRILEPDNATLEDLHIEPRSVLQLKVDENDDGGDTEAALIRNGVQKEGFKGTELLNWM